LKKSLILGLGMVLMALQANVWAATCATEKKAKGYMVSQQQQMTEQETRFTAEITALQDENTQLKALVEGQMEALLARVAMLEGVQVAAN